MGNAYNKLAGMNEASSSGNLGITFRDIPKNRCAANLHAFLVLVSWVAMVTTCSLCGLFDVTIEIPGSTSSFVSILGQYPSFLTPDTLTLRIGFVIEWILLGGYIIAQMLPNRIAPSDFIVMDATKLYCIGGFISFALALVLFQLPEQSLTGLLLLFVHTYILTKIYFDMDTKYFPKKHSGSWQLQCLVYSGFSVGLAWSVFILLLTFTSCIKQSFGVEVRADVTCSLIALMSVVGSRIIFTKCDLPNTLTTLWALWGIARKNLSSSANGSGDTSAGQSEVVYHTALICMALIGSVYVGGVMYTLLIANRARMSVYYDASVVPGESFDKYSTLNSPSNRAAYNENTGVAPTEQTPLSNDNTDNMLNERLLEGDRNRDNRGSYSTAGGDGEDLDL